MSLEINTERFEKAHHLTIQEDVDFVHGESCGAEDCSEAIRAMQTGQIDIKELL